MGVTIPQLSKQIGKLFADIKELRQANLQLEQRVGKLELQLRRNEETLGVLIAWMATSANSPITNSEAQKLIEKLTKDV